MIFLGHLDFYQKPLKEISPKLVEDLAFSLASDFFWQRISIYYPNYPLTTSFYTKVNVVPFFLEKLFSIAIVAKAIESKVDKSLIPTCLEQKKEAELALKVAFFVKAYLKVFLPQLFSYTLYYACGITYFSLPSLMVQAAGRTVFSLYLSPANFIFLRDTIGQKYQEENPHVRFTYQKMTRYIELFYVHQRIKDPTKKKFPTDSLLDKLFKETWEYLCHLEMHIAIQDMQKGEIFFLVGQIVLNDQKTLQSKRVELPQALFYAIQTLREIEFAYLKRLNPKEVAKYPSYFYQGIPLEEYVEPDPANAEPPTTPVKRTRNPLLEDSVKKVETSPFKRRRSSLSKGLFGEGIPLQEHVEPDPANAEPPTTPVKRTRNPLLEDSVKNVETSPFKRRRSSLTKGLFGVG